MKVGDRVKYVGTVMEYAEQARGRIGLVTKSPLKVFESWSQVCAGDIQQAGGKMKFKKGDRVRCIDFDGATGRALEKMPTVLLVYGGHTNSYRGEFVTVGEDDPDARRERLCN